MLLSTNGPSSRRPSLHTTIPLPIFSDSYSDARTHGYQGTNRHVRLTHASSFGGGGGAPAPLTLALIVCECDSELFFGSGKSSLPEFMGCPSVWLVPDAFVAGRLDLESGGVGRVCMATAAFAELSGVDVDRESEPGTEVGLIDVTPTGGGVEDLIPVGFAVEVGSMYKVQGQTCTLN